MSTLTQDAPVVKPCTLSQAFDAWRRVHDAETDHDLDAALAALYDELMVEAGEPTEADREWWRARNDGGAPVGDDGPHDLRLWTCSALEAAAGACDEQDRIEEGRLPY